MQDKVHVCDLAPAEMAEHGMLQTIVNILLLVSC